MDPDALHSLTGREREVLREVARGLSGVEIAERLHVSAAIAKTHVSLLLMKLAARDRALDEYVYDALLAPSVTRRLIAEFARRPRRTSGEQPPATPLTQRELEVLGLVARGSSNAEIGRSLYLSENTIKTQRDPNTRQAIAPG